MAISKTKLERAREDGKKDLLQDLGYKLVGWGRVFTDTQEVASWVADKREGDKKTCLLEGFLRGLQAAGIHGPVIQYIKGAKDLEEAGKLLSIYNAGYKAGQHEATPICPISPDPSPVLPEPVLPFGVILESDEKRLCAEGNKIAAIKAVRGRCNLGLKEAKDVIEAYFSQVPVGAFSAA